MISLDHLILLAIQDFRTVQGCVNASRILKAGA